MGCCGDFLFMSVSEPLKLQHNAYLLRLASELGEAEERSSGVLSRVELPDSSTPLGRSTFAYVRVFI